MALSAFDDLSAEPTPEQLAGVLKGGMKVWISLQSWLTRAGQVDAWEWGSSGKKYGWGLRGKSGDRVLLYLIPQRGFFLVGFVLGDRALKALQDVPLSSETREAISSAKKYGEGTGFRVPVRTTSDLADVKALTKVKREH